MTPRKVSSPVEAGWSLPKYRGPGNIDPTHFTLFLTGRWAAKAALGDERALRQLRHQVALIKATRLVGSDLSILAPPTEDAEAAATWASPMGGPHLRKPAPEFTRISQEIRDLLADSLRSREYVQTRLVLIQHVLTKRDTASTERLPDSGENALQQFAEAERMEWFLRLDRLLGCGSSPSILDNASSRALENFIDQHATEELLALYPPRKQEALSLSVGPLYVLAALPDVGDLPVELLMEWSREMHDSLVAFRGLLTETAQEVTLLGEADDAQMLLSSVAPVLDGEYRDLKKRIDASKLTRVMRELAPAYASSTTGTGVVAALNLSRPLVSVGSLGGMTLGQAVLTAYNKIRKARALRGHPMYWRYKVSRPSTLFRSVSIQRQTD